METMAIINKKLCPTPIKGSYIMKYLLAVCLILIFVCCVAKTKPKVNTNVVLEGDIKIEFKTGRISLPAEVLPAETISVKRGQSIDFIGQTHASVGQGFQVNYDSAYFQCQHHNIYSNPKSIARNECGGDRATLTYNLTTIKSGTTTVTCIDNWRGDTVGTKDYIIVIK